MKKTGKVLSLVLSLALVASSLVATTASAATSRPSETATIKLTSDSIALSNGGKDVTLTSPELVSNFVVASAELADHSDVKSALSLKDVAVTSGSEKVKLNKTDSDNDGVIDSVTLTLKSANVVGPVELTARYEGKVQRGSDEEANTRVYGTAKYTVTIYQKGKAYIAAAATGPTENPTDVASMAMNDEDTTTLVVETPDVSETDAGATWTQDKTVCIDKPADPTGDYTLVSVSGVKCTPSVSEGVITLKNGKSKSTDTFAQTGKISVLAQKYNKDGTAKKESVNRASAKTEVKAVYEADETDTMISKYSSKTYIGNAEATKGNKGSLKDITGCDVVLAALTTMYGGKIGNVTTTAGGFKVQDGIVGNISTVANAPVTVSGGSVGDVVVVTDATLLVSGGSVQDVSGAGEVRVVPSAADTPVKAGNLSAKTIFVNSDNKANITAGDITAVEDADITLTGDMVKVGKIDGDYRSAALTFNDFKGSVAAPAHAYTEGVNATPKFLSVTASGEETNTTITGTTSLYEVILADGASLTFADKANIGANGVSGDGVLKFAPNALYTKGDITTSIRLTKDFKVGDVVFTAATDAVDDNDFSAIGFTTEKVATSSTVDSFKVKDINFASLNIQGSSKIPVGTTETYTAVTYPDGTKLPDGYSISWSFSGNSDYLAMTADEKDSSKVTVKAVKEDKTFSSLNKGTLTATVVDADGFADDSYAPVTLDVSIGAKPSAFKIDSVPSTMKIGQQYTVKITGTDATAPQVAFAGDFAIINSKTVSGYDTFVKFTAAKSGEHGVYVSGTKVAVIKVDTASICDTKTVTKKAGQSYTFKVTSSAVSFVPQFGVASISGNIKPTKQVGKDFYYTVKATSAKGAHGVYINGVKVATYTFA